MTRREEYDRYESYAKIDRQHRAALMEGVAKIIRALTDGGVTNNPEVKEPMSDVSEVDVRITRGGAGWDSPYAVDVCIADGGGWTVIRMEPYPEEESQEVKK